MAKFTKAFMPPDVFEKTISQITTLNKTMDEYFYNLTLDEEKDCVQWPRLEKEQQGW